MEKLYTPQEVADELKIKKHTVYDLIKRGELSSSKIGKQLRISAKDLSHYLETSSTSKTSSMTMPSSSSLSYPENSLLKNDYLLHQTGFIICGQDPVLDILCTLIASHPQGLPTLRSYMGSYNSLYALYFDKVHIATSHLWDAITNTYNISYIRHLLPGEEVIILHLFKRMQGFYVAKGNPKSITHFRDLARKDVLFANREKGSGTRVLLDAHINALRLPPQTINGYSHEYLSPIALAAEVASGNIDVAIGDQNTLQKFPMLDYIPIQLENYDLVFKEKNLQRPSYQAVVEIIQSSTFKRQISLMSGYDTSQTGQLLQ